MDLYTTVIESLFGLALFANGILFIPQALKIYKSKSSQSISLMTFCGFILIQFISVLYGFMRDDWILAIGFLFAMFTCLSVVILALFYKLK